MMIPKRVAFFRMCIDLQLQLAGTQQQMIQIRRLRPYLRYLDQSFQVNMTLELKVKTNLELYFVVGKKLNQEKL